MLPSLELKCCPISCPRMTPKSQRDEHSLVTCPRGRHVTTFNPIEQEAIVLNAVWGMIDDMVNYEVFVKPERTVDTVLMFSTATHMRLFNVLLADFLSQPQPERGGSIPFDLSRPCLPGSSSRRFRNAHHHGFCPLQLAVAWDQRPDRRTRRALLHLQYSCEPPFGPAILVTQDPLLP